MNTISYFPRFLSGFVEISDGWWIGRTLLSGTLEPFSSGKTLKSITRIGTFENKFSEIHGEKLYNNFGEILVNNVTTNTPLKVDKVDGIANFTLGYDSTLQIVDGKLSVKPIIRLNSDYDLKFAEPLAIKWDEIDDPHDKLGGTLSLQYDEDDFSLSDSGQLKTVDLNITSQGAIKVRKADILLGENDVKLRTIGIDVSEDFQQTNGVLAIRNQGNGRVPFWQIGSGFSSNANFSFDGASTLSVGFVKLTESYTLPNSYAASVGYVMQAYQAGVNTGIDIEPALNARRIIKVRTNPFSMRINGANQLEVNTGNSMKQDADGIDVRHDLSIKEDIAFGIGVNLSESQRALKLLPDGLTVAVDESGSLKIDSVLGLDVRLAPNGAIQNITGVGLSILPDPSGVIFRDLPGLDIRVDEVSIQKTLGALRVNLSQVDRGLQQLADGLGVRTQLNDPIKSGFDGLYLQLSPDDSCLAKTTTGLEVMVSPDSALRKEILGLDLAVDNISIKKDLIGISVNLSETDRGIQQLPDGLGIRTQTGDVIGSGYDGLFLKISPNDSCLMKSTTGLEVAVAVDAPFVKEITGLDLKLNPDMTLVKSLAGLGGNYKGESPDITVAGNMIICNITVGGKGLQKVGNVISLLPEITDQIDKVEDALDASEAAQNTANNAKTVADSASDLASQASKTAGDLANKLGDLSSVIDTVGDLSKQIGIAVGTSALTSAAVTSMSAAALGAIAKSQAQALVASKVGAATGIAGVFAGAFGAIGGAIAGAFGKKGNTVNHISNNTYNIGTIKEKDTDDEEDTYLYGFTLGCGTDYSVSLYPDRALNPCTIMPLLGSGLLPVESTNSRTGMFTVIGGIGVSGNIHAGGSVFSNNQRLASETFVTSRGYITSSSLSSYLTTSTASSTYQPILTAGTGLAKSGNTLSVIPNQSQIVQVGSLNNLTVTGQSTFNDITKHFKVIEGWQETRTPPPVILTQPASITVNSGITQNQGFSAATFAPLNLHKKVLYGTVVYMSPIYPTFYTGNITLTANVEKIVVSGVQGTGSFTLGIGYTVFRPGTGVINKTVATTTAAYSANGTYVVSLPFSVTISVNNGDTIVPYITRSGTTTLTQWTAVATFSQWEFSGLPFLHAWEQDATSLSFYPDGTTVNKLTSSPTGFSSNVNLFAPNLYSKTETDALLNGKQASGDYATNASLTSALTPYLLSSSASVTYQQKLTVGAPLSLTSGTQLGIDLSSYATNSTLGNYSTTTAMNTAISNAVSNRENPLTFSTPLTRTSNTIGIDLSGYYTKAQVDSAVASKQSPINVSPPLEMGGNSIFLNTSQITKVGTLIDLNVNGIVYAGTVYSSGSQVATRQDLTGFLSNATAASTYQQIITAGTGLIKNGSTLSVNPNLVLDTIQVSSIVTNKAWSSPNNMTSNTLNGFTVSHSPYTSTSTSYPGWRLFTMGTNGWRTQSSPYASYYDSGTSPSGVWTATGTATTNNGTIYGEWVQLACPTPVLVTSMTLTPQASYLSNSPLLYHLLASNDGTTWVFINSWNTGQMTAERTHTISTSGVKYTYFRLCVEWIYQGTYCVLQRLRFDGLALGTVDFQTSSGTSGEILSAGYGLTKTGTVMAVNQSVIQNKLSLVSPLKWGSVADTLTIDMPSITKVGTLQQTLIQNTGGLFTDFIGQMVALRLGSTSTSAQGIALSLDSISVNGKDWTIQSASDGNMYLNSNGLRRIGFRDDGSILLTPNSRQIPPVQISAVDDGLGGAYYKLNVAGGSSSSLANEVMRCTVDKTSIFNPVHIQSTSPVNYNWSSLNFSSGGALQVEGGSLFHGTMVISGRSTVGNTGQYRWYSYDGNGLSSVAGQYSLILGQNGRMLVASGSMINCFSDAREKRDIQTIDGEKALNIVKNQRAVSFKYKAKPDEQRYGMVAQEALENDYLRDLVSVAQMGEEERYVMNTADIAPILWAAVRELNAKVEKLEAQIKDGSVQH